MTDPPRPRAGSHPLTPPSLLGLFDAATPGRPGRVTARMSAATVAELRRAVVDPAVVANYFSHVRIDDPGRCWLWVGAISGQGHGRFQIGHRQILGPGGIRRRRTFVVIAHRFGYALHHGVDALLDVPLIAHRCDNPLCQNPACWQESNHRHNGQDASRRRNVIGGPLADVRGARGRARAVRDAAKSGQPVEQAMRAGLPPVHRAQLDLFSCQTQG